jgi:hypothetical protein
MSAFSATIISAKRFNPRDGAYRFIGEYSSSGIKRFRTPEDDTSADYVLALEAT